MVDAVHISETTGLGMAALLARRGASAVSIGAALSAAIPTGPTSVAADSLVFMGVAPGTWLVQTIAPQPGWIGALRASLTGLASVSDQSGAYRTFRLVGPGARTVLQRGAAIDLEDTVFGPGAVAVTAIAHLDVLIRRLDGADAYSVAVFRSSAESFLRWLDAAVEGL